MVRIPDALKRIQIPGLIAGLLAAAAAMIGLFLGAVDSFFQAYLYAYMFWLSITLGSLAITMMYYLMGGTWGIALRRIIEAASRNLWLMAVLFIPILFGIPQLYPWARPEVVQASEVLQHKSIYLNVPFFIGRAVFYFAVWIFLAERLMRWSREPRLTTDPEHRRGFQRLSAIGLILYALTMSFAAIDWLMSLQPEWYSNIYSLIVITGQALSGFAFAILLVPLFAPVDPRVARFKPDNYRDLGAILLTAVVMWAYIAFSQLLILWYANLPHEVTWYIARSNGGWIWIGITVAVVQFVVPFLILVSLQAKRSRTVLVSLSSLILVARLLDYFWQVKPAFYPDHLVVSWLDPLLPIAIGGVWIFTFIYFLKRTPMAPLARGQAVEAPDTGREQITT